MAGVHNRACLIESITMGKTAERHPPECAEQHSHAILAEGDYERRNVIHHDGSTFYWMGLLEHESHSTEAPDMDKVRAQ